MIRPQTTTWETRLIDLAHQGLIAEHDDKPVEADREKLNDAYAHCDALTSRHSRTFFMASALLPPEKRRAARALYAFCRVSDDLVDRPDPGSSREALDAWRQKILSSSAHPEDPVALAWADTRSRYYVPPVYAEQLIDGIASDLDHTRYATFGDLAAYCYSVASTVGLMAMHIVGFRSTEAIPYAVKLGVALQLTNILRDVGEDWRNGRLYLPQDELAEFGLSEADLAAGRADARWQRFIAFQIQRNRRLYAEARPGIGLLDPDGRFAIAAAADLYQAILDDIEAHGGDVFNRRAHVGRWGKLRRLPGIWWASRRLNGRERWF